MKIKKDISLIIGVAIPILMIVFVAASIYLPGLFSPPPKFNFLYVTGDRYYEKYQFVVENSRLTKREVKYPERYTPEVARLYIHDVSRNESKEISFEDAQKLYIDPNTKSQDDFEVVYGSYDGGIFSIFFGREDYDTVYLKGHNTSKKLNLSSSGNGHYYYYNSFRFLGWIK